MKPMLLCFIFTCILILSQCTYPPKLNHYSALKNEYHTTSALDDHYRAGYFGAPDLASFDRLNRYKQQAWNALNQCKAIQNSAISEKPCLDEALTEITRYQSYLNALGAVQATRNTFTGF